MKPEKSSEGWRTGAIQIFALTDEKFFTPAGFKTLLP